MQYTKLTKDLTLPMGMSECYKDHEGNSLLLQSTQYTVGYDFSTRLCPFD